MMNVAVRFCADHGWRLGARKIQLPWNSEILFKTRVNHNGNTTRRYFADIPRKIWDRKLSPSIARRTFVSLSLTSPFAFLKRKHEEDQSNEILKNIPKEVFSKDILKKPKRTIFWRIVYWIVYNIELGLRFVRLSCTYFPILVLYPFACVSRPSKRAWWRLLLFACEHSGPTFIKLGQWASTRRDLFDEEFCLIFSKLHNQTQKHSWYWTKQKLRKAFGKNWKKIFAKIERKPVGSGCVAQVRPTFLSISPVFSFGVKYCIETF